MAVEQARKLLAVSSGLLIESGAPNADTNPAQMPALFFGMNRMFGMLDKAAYARLSRAVSAWMNEKRQVDQI
ncbi:unnamed protein product [Ectocarpus sp. CCAP 1310/34]|nr:unnamed protein product [Ectocarpus sp. CCAP 1310/34]